MPNTPPAPRTIEQLDEQITRPSEAVLAAIGRCSGDFLVLGAAGKMGFHITRLLQRSLQTLGRPGRVTAVSRFTSPPSRESFQQAGIPWVAADLSDPAQLASIEPAENVIFLAGVKFGTAAAPALLERMNATMPQRVADRFRQSRIVALSTGCVYSFTTPQAGGSSEESETDPPGLYAQSCLRREAAFIEGSARHGTPCVLVRLNYSVELRYGVLVDIAQQVKAGMPVNVEMPYVNVIWQGDAVAQIVQCLPHAASPPLILNLTGSEVLRVGELARRFGQRLGRAPEFCGSEAPCCWLSSNARARRLLGEPTVSVDCMIDWIADWLDRGGTTLGKPTHFHSRDGNY
jgi:nucleoside-diphosphate-sugar epimerase